MKKKALFTILSDKAKNNLLILLDNLDLAQPQTKLMVNILDKLPLKKKSSLIGLPKIDRKVIKACQNIPKVATIQAKDLNSLDLVSFQYLIMPKESIEVIKKTFLKNQKS